MSYKTKTGKVFGSAFAGRRYDEAHSEPKAIEVKKPHEAQESHDESMHPVVAEHGPAHTITLKHDHEMGKHSLVSNHEDGHENRSEHSNVKEAYTEASKLADAQGHHEMDASTEDENYVNDDLV